MDGAVLARGVAVANAISPLLRFVSWRLDPELGVPWCRVSPLRGAGQIGARGGKAKWFLSKQIDGKRLKTRPVLTRGISG